MKKLSILGSALFALPLFFASCSSESCRTCDCSITETTVETPTQGAEINRSNESAESFTACDSDVNNPAASSWEYYDSNPTIRTERTDNKGTSQEVKFVTTTSYSCSCEED